MTKLRMVAASAATLLATMLVMSAASPVYAANTAQETVQLHGPASHGVHSPYQAALECLATHLSPEQKSESFGVLSFPDKTAKFNAVDSSGTGAFSTQGGADRLVTAIAATGVRVVAVDPEDENQMDRIAKLAGEHLAASGDTFNLHDIRGNVLLDKKGDPLKTKTLPLVDGNIYVPMHMVSGAITSADLVPGKSLGFQIFGVGPNYREFSLLVGMDIKSVLMPIGNAPGGTVTYAKHFEKDVIAREYTLGGAAIVGTALASVDFDSMKREGVQFAEGIALDRAAYKLVSSNFGVHVCDPLLDYGDQLASSNQ